MMNTPKKSSFTGSATARQGPAVPSDLTGQVAVVTGASRGVGKAIALRLGRLGANVVVNYSRDTSGAADTVAAIDAAGSRAIDIRADVSKPREVEDLLEAARTHFGGLDIVVANAGIDETGLLGRRG